jgi:hypothetical protein
MTMVDNSVPIVVYHVAAMGNWQDVLREQLTLLRVCELAGELAKIGDCVRVTHVGLGVEYLHAAAAEHGVPIQVVLSDPNIHHFETFAMITIERLAKVELVQRPILYLHTKGVSSPGHRGKIRWRHAMELCTVARWRQNVKHIADGAGYDAVGVNWHQHGQQHFSGNFWIARPDWIRRLPDYVAYHHALSLTRYTCEMWIGAQQWCRAYSLLCADEPWHAYDNWGVA